MARKKFLEVEDLTITKEQEEEIFYLEEIEDPVALEEILRDKGYLDWKKRDPGEDSTPCRITINGKYTVEYKVGSGECVEATWEHTIWLGEMNGAKLIR